MSIITKFKAKLEHPNYIESKKLSPILKWAGGKEQELKYIIPQLPPFFNNYYEPFVGGGAVFTAVQAQKYFINDKSNELVALYKSITDENRALFFFALDEIVQNWDILTEIIEKNALYFVDLYKKYSNNTIDETELKSIIFEFVSSNSTQFNLMFSKTFDFNTAHFIKELKINLIRKTKRMKVLEQQKEVLTTEDILSNIETALKSAFYMQFRYLHNNCEKYEINTALSSAIFLFIRNFAYSGMFRYNASGDFNVPYGGIAYNRKNFLKKIDYLRSFELQILLETTTIENLDFQDFLTLHQPKKDDFIFLDPPYDTEFSTYAKNEFSKTDQERLADFLIKKCEAQWMMVIKNTDFIFNLYDKKGLNIQSFDKTYLVSFMNRNDKNVEHLVITNY